MPTASMALEPGSAIGEGRYRLVRRIGAGGMGEVWIAKNRMTGAEVAIKTALGGVTSEEPALRLRHEARLGAMLAHRGIVRIFDLVEGNGGALFLVMELLQGETLERYLARRGPLPLEEALAIAVPVLSALAHAHASGIVHRDVTPANVFLAIDPDGHVTPKLLDFGIAKVPAVVVSRTIDGRALGTPRYMAPERIREQPDIDGRSDLFSVGVVLYEMLTGVCPFAAGSPAASLAAVLEVVVDPDPRIDPRVWLELRRSLAKRPYERHDSAGAMARNLLASSGQTEAALTEVLREAPIACEKPGETASAVAAVGTRTVGGHSYGGRSSVPLSARRAVAWFAGAVVVGAAIAGLRLSARAPVPSSAPGSVGSEFAPAPARAPLSASASATGSVSAPPMTASASASVSASASASASAFAPVGPAPARRQRPKPVATTPGF